jgi:hypothetical protein
MVMKNLAEVKDTINDLAHDIKAEVILADLLENGLSQQDYIIISDGLFRRRYKKDITHAEVTELNNGQELLEIHLTREGIYDALPEALFHGLPDERLSSGQDMAKLSKKQKLEEKACRNFFLPFENEIFHQRVQLEQSERKVLHKFSENLFNDIFPDFWNLDRSLPGVLVSRLMLFLHYSHRIAGNIDLTAQALETILDEKVTARWIGNGNARISGNPGLRMAPSCLGSSLLGKDFVCGDHPPEWFPSLEFTIGPLSGSRIEDYLENGPIDRFLDVFFGYFVPMEVIPVRKIIGHSGKNEFMLSPDAPVYLGYDTIL